MSSFQTIIDAHLSMLKDRGYTEDALRAFPYPKTFKERITEKFAVAVLNGLMDNQEHYFTVPMTGFFRGDRDAVLIELGFHYSPHTGDFKMNGISGTLGAAKVDIPLKNPVMDLPNAADVYAWLVLNPGKEIKDRKPLYAEKKAFIAMAATFNRASVEHAGYLPPLENSSKPDWFLRAFDEKITPLFPNLATQPNPTFVLPFSKRLEGDSHRTQFRLLYQFDKENPLLADIKAVHASAPTASMLYLIHHDMTLPSVSRVQGDLATDGMKKFAALMHATIRYPHHRR
jgi:hypothetical protein